MLHRATVRAYTPAMPVCDMCREEYQQVASFCPRCGTPLTSLAARLREAGTRRPTARNAEAIVKLPDLEDVETL